MKPAPLPYKIFVKNYTQLKQMFPDCVIKETTAKFNMLFLKDNQFAAVAEDGKFYLLETNI